MDSKMIGLRLLSVFEDIFNVDKADLKIKRTDIEDWDSLGHIRLMVAIEEEFKISIPWQTAAELKDIASIVQYLVNRIKG